MYIYTVYAEIFAWFNIHGIRGLEAVRKTLNPQKFWVGLLYNVITWPSPNIKMQKLLKDKIREIYTPQKLKRIQYIYIYIYIYIYNIYIYYICYL